MPRIQPFRAAKSLTQELMSEIGNLHSVTIVPPDNVEENTDEDEVDDDAVGAQTVSGDVAGTYEVNYTEDESGKETDRSNSQSAKWRGIHHNVNCSLKKEEYNEKEAYEILMSLPSDDPVNLFELFFDSQLFDILKQESLRYAMQKNKHNISLTVDDIKNFIGFLILSGYHTLPRERLYWSTKEDFGVPLVKSCFSRDKYLQIKSISIS